MRVKNGTKIWESSPAVTKWHSALLSYKNADCSTWPGILKSLKHKRNFHDRFRTSKVTKHVFSSRNAARWRELSP